MWVKVLLRNFKHRADDKKFNGEVYTYLESVPLKSIPNDCSPRFPVFPTAYSASLSDIPAYDTYIEIQTHTHFYINTTFQYASISRVMKFKL